MYFVLGFGNLYIIIGLDGILGLLVNLLNVEVKILKINLKNFIDSMD